ncbi:DUF3307 domain-containing protein [Candidatus Pacearchaeota archaeon]|nr:DUF3307 domain-containing protein [Candidatus Pacearchaeota archaeon]
MIWLIFAHYIGDFALQKEWIALNKGKYWYTMLCHGMIWTACICVALQCNGLFDMGKASFLWVGHVACDQWAFNARKRLPEDRNFPTWHFYVDQTWHIIQCLIVYYL